MSTLPIAVVSRDTGIAKEVLRKWEKRYGFPLPERDDNGNRLYADDQVARLHLIGQLIDSGMRPGLIVPLDLHELQILLANRQAPMCSPQHISHRQLVDWLQQREPDQLRQHLQAEIARAGLTVFIGDTLPAMSQIIGLAWQRGEISLLDEHVYFEIMQDLLRVAFVSIHRPGGAPRILVTTPVGELHTFGMLMLQVFLALQGSYCISLGAQTPPEEIALAAQYFRIDIVCVSISACFPQRKISELLRKIRLLLPKQTRCWAGGAGVARLKTCPRGVKIFFGFEGVSAELKKVIKQKIDA